MKPYHDYIKFDDYQRDMEDLSADAARVIEVLSSDVKMGKEMLAAAAMSAGGEIKIFDKDVQRVDQYDLIIERDEADACFVISAKRKLN